MVGLELCYIPALLPASFSLWVALVLTSSCPLDVRKGSLSTEKVRYTFQSSLWGLRAKSDISTNLTLAQENLKSLKKGSLDLAMASPVRRWERQWPYIPY